MTQLRPSTKMQRTGNNAGRSLNLGRILQFPFGRLSRMRFMLLALLTLLICSLGLPVWGSVVSAGTGGVLISQSSTSSDAQRLDQQARQQFAAGQFSVAAQLFQQAVAAFERQADVLRQGLALSNLSLCYQQLGNWDEASATIAQSLNLLADQANSQAGHSSAYAQALDIQANLQLTRGQAELALATWEQAAQIYQRLGDRPRQLDSQINQSQALQALGLYRRAIALLIEVNQALASEPSTLPQAIALRNLGDALRVTGDLNPRIAEIAALQQLLAQRTGGGEGAPQRNDQQTEQPNPTSETPNTGDLTQSYQVLLRAREVAEQLQSAEAIALANLSLGNTARTLKDSTQALQFYQEAANYAPSPTLRLQILVSHFGLLVDNQRQTEAQADLQQIESILLQLPSNRTTLYARINLAQTLLNNRNANALPNTAQTAALVTRLLTNATAQATELGDQRAIAYAQGLLGEVYEQAGNLQTAQDLTERALRLSQSIRASDVAYRWQWQLGRVQKARWEADGKRSEAALENAIASYQQAIATLESLRTDLATVNPEVQFAFRNAVEPIHRQLVDLLLSKQKPDLKAARDVIESLQLAELDNFFRVACLTAAPELVDRVDEKAAVIYPILLPDRLATIVSLPPSAQVPTACSALTDDAEGAAPSRLLCSYTPASSVGRQQIERLARSIWQDLDQENTLERTRPWLQQMYDWLIRPEAADLEASGVETLVFVLDGALRNIPMSPLHDGQQFLIERYSIAVTPGLQLRSPLPLATERLRALLGGLSEASQGFASLPNVREEVRQIEAQIPEAQILLDEQFTDSEFQGAIASVPFSVVHLATHGQFSGRLEDTFILTRNGRLNVNQLSDLLRTADLTQRGALELLVLSACETAAGDDRAALGLAGVAVRAGARSTVATLWQVSDASTSELMKHFYEELTAADQKNKAKALRQAQLSILKNPTYRQEPFYWAAFILVGNWL